MGAIIRSVMTQHGASGEGFAIHDAEVARLSSYYNPSITPPARFWVLLEEDGTVIGGAGFGHLAGASRDICELRKMYFLPAARGRGWGRVLLDLCVEHARDAGYREMYLETLETMHRARALYEAAGFERCENMGQTGHFGCDAFYRLDL